MTPPNDSSAPFTAPAAADQAETSDPRWYKDAIIYQLHVKAFFDADDDGVGDFKGLCRKLDYLQDLGVTALWLMPFYPSPLRDDGYDIADYKSINPSYGRMADFKMFVREAHRRGLKIITELIINHTSDQHPWFQRARRAKPHSPLRDFYVWSDTDQKFAGTPIVFVDMEKSNWEWDPVAQAYYWHRFYAHQPDLNFDNPRVFRAVVDVMRFWLDLGVDGMRLDAVPYLIEREGTTNECLPETHEVLRRLRRELDMRYGDRMLLAEANQWPEDVMQFFGAGDECHMAFHFPLMPRIYMAVSTEDRHPITDIMRQTPEIPATCQWAVFLRNHDELTLEMVTDRERDYLWNYYAADRRARINLGIRRRLAPLMENDRRKIELLNALLISMPGTPVFYYGDEIGMGDNVFLRDRDGVRTPMQWSFDRNGGFSRADPASLYLPPIMDPVYGFEAVNVEAQSRSPSSLLNWMKRLIAARRSRRAFGRGTLRFLYPSNRKVIAYLRAFADEIILCVANLSRSPQAAELDLAEFRGHQPVELLGRSVFPTIGDQPYMLTLQAHSFFWFDLVPGAAGEASLQSSPPEFVTLVMPHGWGDLFTRHNLPQLETEALSAFLPRQRWHGIKCPLKTASVRAYGEIGGPSQTGETFLATVVETGPEPDRQRYFLPLTAIWSPAETELRQGLMPATLAELRQARREGALVDALAIEGFAASTLEAIRAAATVPLAGGALHFHQLKNFAAPPLSPVLRRGGTERPDRAVFLVEEYGSLEFYRKLETGTHPEIEMSRFLAERAGFANTAAPLATIELDLSDDDGPQMSALGILFAFIRDQGDGWTQALNYLTRYLDDALSTGTGDSDLLAPDFFFLRLARQLGIRTAEMHRALAEHSLDDPDFSSEPIGRQDIELWQAGLEEASARMMSLLDREQAGLPPPARDLCETLLARRSELSGLVRGLAPPHVAAHKTRIHGNFGLAQVMVVQNDFFIAALGGDPALPIPRRRSKDSPLRDVARMIRSFDFATAVAVRQLAESRPAAEPLMAQLAKSWRKRAVEGFRAAYHKTMRGCSAYPASRSQARALTRFFVLERAVDEVCRELERRPLWAAVSLQSILDIMAAARGESGAAPA